MNKFKKTQNMNPNPASLLATN